MSKYSALCTAYTEALNHYRAYRDACGQFAHKLVRGMITYLGCPQDMVDFIPVREEPQLNRRYTVWGAMDLGDDTFYHLGVRLIIDPSSPDEIWPQDRLLLHLLVKKDDDAFVVQVKGLREKFRIHSDDPDKMKTFYDFIFSTIRDEYKKGFVPVGQAKAKRPLGFSVPDIPEPQHG